MIEILSPHIDDAAFSLACFILQKSEESIPIEITTCFSISNYLANGNGSNVLEEVVRIRKGEDHDFSRQLKPSVKFNYLDLDDAPLRGYQKCGFQDRFSEADQQQMISLQAHLKSKNSPVIVPLGLGNHVDHIICHQAAETVRNRIFAFYEDLPYAGRIPEAEILERVAYIENNSQLRLMPLIAGTSYIHRKEQLCNLYPSQLKDWYLEKILHQLNRLQGERLWVVQESG